MLSRVLDNEGTVFFAIVMAVWATIFMEMWKREQFRLAYRWNVHELVQVEEPPRPEFIALVGKKFKANRETLSSGNPEPHIPFWSNKVPIKMFTIFIITLSIMFSILILFCVISFKIYFAYRLRSNQNEVLRQLASLLATVIGAVLSLFSITFLTQVFNRVAVFLTDNEHHRTQTQYDDALTLKLYLLQFVNMYSSIFYVAFVQGPGAGLPGDPNNSVITQFGCDAGDCLFELFMQMTIIMVGKQLINFLIENIRPLLVMIQFGFITIFVAAFPLAPMFALINNILEIRGDAKKFLNVFRRPVATRTKDIGVWADILNVLASIAVRSNALVIAFTSQFIQRLVYTYNYREKGLYGFDNYINFTLSKMSCDRFEGLETPCQACYYPEFREPPESDNPYLYTKVYWNILAVKFIFVFTFENVVIVLTSLLAHIVPDIPGKLAVLIRRETILTNEIIVRAEMNKGKNAIKELLGNFTKRASKMTSIGRQDGQGDQKQDQEEEDDEEENFFFDFSTGMPRMVSLLAHLSAFI
ncbi:Anoctamin-3 [Cichlidogyrus casuarinus]|uniref:Anoctamin n=1 Tax=Cichlidogyrus casuarinus TaxID=1844966 RepID=A0ABD2Q8V5_9PLAT